MLRLRGGNDVDKETEVELKKKTQVRDQETDNCFSYVWEANGIYGKEEERRGREAGDSDRKSVV